MADTKHLAPTDAEIDAAWRESVAKHEKTADFVRDFARAVLAKWGAQPVERDPLTDERLLELWRAAEPTPDGRSASWSYARAIEAAHGIGIKNGDSHGLKT